MTAPLLVRPRLGAALLTAALLESALGAAAVLGASGPWVDHRQARLRLVSRWATAAPAGDAGLGVEVTLAPGWHVYWKNPGDAGYPPRLEAKGAAPLRGLRLLFPAPERFELAGELVAFGYAGEVIYPLDARLESGAAGRAAAIAVTFDYLVCAESCVPHVAELTLELPVGVAREDAGVAPRLDAWRRRLPIPAGGPGAPAVVARLETAPGGELALVVVLSAPGLTAAAPDLLFETHPRLALGRPRFVAGAAGPGFRVPARRLDITRPLPDRLAFAWTATGFELAGAPASFTGTLELERPAAP